ncbi:glycine zipper family protein [Vibrio mediterranei]|uniref:glycine zipper family protein n=1 Tax=Vibrio mediterranei TaxID=689 RepID=UPI004067B889
MKKIILAGVLVTLSCSALAQEQQRGGDIIDQRSKLIFNYDNVTRDVAEQELSYCQNLANQTQEEAVESKGSGARGLLKGAAAGAAVGAISGGSGTDAAKVGAAGGLVVGRMAGKGNESAQQQKNLENYKVVLRNCMIERKYVALN